MFLFQGADGRIPHDVADPIAQGVWPLWSGEPVPWWRFNERFSRNLTVVARPSWVARLAPRWQGIQFLPLVLFSDSRRACAVALRRGMINVPRQQRNQTCRIDQQQESRGDRQERQDD